MRFEHSTGIDCIFFYTNKAVDSGIIITVVRIYCVRSLILKEIVDSNAICVATVAVPRRLVVIEASDQEGVDVLCKEVIKIIYDVTRVVIYRAIN